ncbi:DUF5361 domain-containing protein [Nocardia tengchongensis]
MAYSLGDQPGGILSLAALLEEHSEAIEYDLIVLGLRLRDLGCPAFSWRDLKAIVNQASPDSALVRARFPEQQPWQLSQMLLADLVDTVRWVAWTKSTDARHNRNRPDPIPRPGIKSAVERIGTAVSAVDMNRFLGWDR